MRLASCSQWEHSAHGTGAIWEISVEWLRIRDFAEYLTSFIPPSKTSFVTATSELHRYRSATLRELRKKLKDAGKAEALKHVGEAVSSLIREADANGPEALFVELHDSMGLARSCEDVRTQDSFGSLGRYYRGA